MAKSSDPETLTQAREHGRNIEHYKRLGLCNGCAGQAAWGHQNGFYTIHPPCNLCQPIVDTFPVDEPGPWRRFGRRNGRALPSAMPSQKP
ncbi:hypothetical protein J2Y66_003467 [Paenarthrobacter nitroguajacolicus]|nr:hypothetical protein [Paenarthrobacter nitroguajacolicus]